jgi:hypothetical protein
MTDAAWSTSTDPAEMFAAVSSAARQWFGFLSPSARAARRKIERKCRLFAVACCIRHFKLWNDSKVDWFLTALRVSEKYADRLSTPQELRRAHNAVHSWLYMVREAKTWWGQRLLGWLALADDDWGLLPPAPTQLAALGAIHRKAVWGASVVIQTALDYPEAFWRGQANTRQESAAILCELLREVFGPEPFHPSDVNPNWRTEAVVMIARSIADYESPRAKPARRSYRIHRAASVQTVEEGHSFAPMPLLANALVKAGCDNMKMLAHCRQPEQSHVRGCWLVDLILSKDR